MTKKYRGTMILTTLLTLSPILIGILLWKKLPEVIATHFDGKNVPNGWSSREMAVFGIPLFLAVMQIFVFFVTVNDPKKRNISDKMFRLILWIIPACSLICCLSCYAVALGFEVNIGMVVSFFLGVLFILVGNYMHKIKHNYTVGIKIMWTLSSEENWNRTHRMASWLWMAGGVAFTLCGILQWAGVLPVIVAVMVVVPMVYSFLLYRRGI